MTSKMCTSVCPTNNFLTMRIHIFTCKLILKKWIVGNRGEVNKTTRNVKLSDFARNSNVK